LFTLAMLFLYLSDGSSGGILNSSGAVGANNELGTGDKGGWFDENGDWLSANGDWFGEYGGWFSENGDWFNANGDWFNANGENGGWFIGV